MKEFFENFTVGFVGSLILVGIACIALLPVILAIALDRWWLLWFMTVTGPFCIGFVYAIGQEG